MTVTMKLLLIVAFSIGCAIAKNSHQGKRDDYHGKAVRFFRGADRLAAQTEMTPSPGCSEGDMLFTERQKEVYHAMQDVDEENRERVRRDTEAVFNIWPNKTFVYQYEAGLSATTKQLFEGAAQIYEERTNIRFVEAIDGSYTGSIEPLTVQQNSSGCFSTVGCMGTDCGGLINLEEGYCETLGIVLHELGHALGRFHEQTRSDRDDYVTVVESNIRSGYEHNFVMANRPTLASYDVQSIMHYSCYAFSINGYAQTMVPADPTDAPKMGKQQVLSRLDAYTFNVAYGAFEYCPTDLWNKCKRGGVPNKHCACDCLPAFEGPYCEIFVPPTACSDIYTEASGTITSPGFPSLYPSNTECTYAIECAVDEIVELNFVQFDLEDWACWYDKMTMMTGDLISEVYPDEYCGDSLDGKQIFTSSNVTVLDFVSDGWYNFAGFQIDYVCIPAASSK